MSRLLQLCDLLKHLIINHSDEKVVETKEETNEIPNLDNSTGFDTQLGALWLENMRTKTINYQEPIACEKLTQKLLILCGDLRQELPVYVTAIRTFERYMDYTIKTNQIIADPFFNLIAITYLAVKVNGEMPAYMTIKWIAETYKEIEGSSKKTVDQKSLQRYQELLKAEEIRIMKALNCNLPVVTEVDDLESIYYMIMRPFIPYRPILNLAKEMLAFFFTFRKWIYNKFREMPGSSEVFGNRFLVPMSVIFCAMKFAGVDDMDMIRGIEMARLNINVEEIFMLSDLIEFKYKLECL